MVRIPHLPTYPHKFILPEKKNRNYRTQHSLGLRRPQDANMSPISIVVGNLCPFTETIAKPNCSLVDAAEEVDIGEVTVLRAAAQNHERVSVLSDLKDYKTFLGAWKDRKGDVGESVSCAEGVRDDRTGR